MHCLSSSDFMFQENRFGPFAEGVRTRSACCVIGGAHAVGRCEKRVPVALCHAGQRPAKLPKYLCVLASAAPEVLAGSGPCQSGHLWRRAPVVEKLISRYLQRAGKLLQRLQRRDSVAVLNARCVAMEQTSPVLDVALAEILRLTDGADRSRTLAWLARSGPTWIIRFTGSPKSRMLRA